MNGQTGGDDMGEERLLDYFYGSEPEQFRFLQVPWDFFTEAEYANITPAAMIMYSHMLYRSRLSRKNGWLDEKGRVYIMYTQAEAEADIHKKKDAVKEAFKELETIVPGGLIERVQTVRGKPYMIYVKNFRIPQKNKYSSDHNNNPADGKSDMKKLSEGSTKLFPTADKTPSGGREIRSDHGGKTAPNYKDLKNKKELEKHHFTHSGDSRILKLVDNRKTGLNEMNELTENTQPDSTYDSLETVQSYVDRQISYTEMFPTLKATDRQLFEDIYRLICSILLASSGKDFTIDGCTIPYKVVRSVFEKLTYANIEYAMMGIDKNRTQVTSMPKYLVSVLYNSYLTMNTGIQQDLKSSGVI